MHDIRTNPEHRAPKFTKRAFGVLVVCMVIMITLTFTYTGLTTATADFPLNREVVILEGESIDTIGEKLEEGRYIESPLLFKIVARHLDADTTIKAGTYTFNEPHSTYELVRLLSEGGATAPLMRLTFPEGYTVQDWDMYTNGVFEETDTEALESNEGKLFPDTYFVGDDEPRDSLILRMKEHYETTVGPLRPLMEERGYTEDEVIIFASILEREANDETSMRMVAGILENRLRADMPLQVDAVFEYYTGKGSSELTLDDLQSDTAYNTYTNLGLPSSPIGNPGLMAIEAVLNPTPSDYYYYLTGNDGEFYYAKSFEEHKRNKARYLR